MVVGMAGLLAGCGDTRTPVPRLSQPAPPTGFRVLQFPSAGLTLSAPTNWTVIRRRAPLLAVISSGDAVVALWRYPRAQPPPVGAPALGLARARLAAAVRARQPGLRLMRARQLEIDQLPAVELDALERVGGHPRRVRSTHIYRRGSEIVIDQYAPPAQFRLVDRQVFSPLRRSLVIGA